MLTSTPEGSHDAGATPAHLPARAFTGISLPDELRAAWADGERTVEVDEWLAAIPPVQRAVLIAVLAELWSRP